MTDPTTPQLVLLLRSCRDQFELYGKNHRAKQQSALAELQESDDPAKRLYLRRRVSEADRKALNNEEMVERIDRMVAPFDVPVKASDDLTGS